MRFKQFIIIEQTQFNEASSEDGFTIKGLSDDEWAAWVEQNCNDYLPRAGRYPIYRGLKNETVELGVKDTNEFTRQSAGGVPNYYTLWMDNAVQWKDYPKRSKSFIGSSNFHNAGSYGELYQLFPANNAKIGICPNDDIWDSFGEVPGGSMHDFARLIKIAFKEIYGKVAAERAMVDWAEFKRLLELTTFSEFIEANKIYVTHGQFARKNYLRLIDYFEEEITPERHGFQHATPANYSVTRADNREIWVQGKVALAKVHAVFNFRSGHRLFPRITELFSRYNIKGPYH